ncbi:MAG TPA: hypothetical protein VGK22_06215 [Candidatus Angelobacter sp.]|jgi:hypothetical protein
MSNKPKHPSNGHPSTLWVRPSTADRKDGHKGINHNLETIPSNSRFLELADIALGLKKPEKKKKARIGALHTETKTEPYSS